DRVLVRGRADGQADARGARLVDDADNTGAQRQLARRDELLKDRGLALVQLRDQRLGRVARGPAVRVEVVRHALLAARDLKELAVKLDAPRDVEPGLLERFVE